MKPVVNVLIIVAIVLILSYTIIVFWSGLVYHPAYVEYELTVDINATGPFSVNLPFPLTREEALMFLFDDLAVSSGDGRCSINSSDHGLALTITGNGSLRLSGHVSHEGDVSTAQDYDKLSMTIYDYHDIDDDTEDAAITSWAFSTVNLTAITYDFHYLNGLHWGILRTYGGGFGHWNYSGPLDAGWQRIDVIGGDLTA